MRLIRLRARALTALLLLLVAGSTLPAGPCSMRAVELQDAVDHACCAKGLTAASPPCCHAQPATPATAILVGRLSPVAMPAIPFVALWTATVMTGTAVHARVTLQLHSPPPAVLRI
jgi:hypothetical protein